MSLKSQKRRNQLKSRFYYYFWGAATIAVFSGQILVGTGYRRMSDSMDAISTDINLLVEVLLMPRGTGKYYPIIPPPDLSEEIDPYIYLERDERGSEIQRDKIAI